MDFMKTIVQINNRDAIPIRAIPYVTGWEVSPDKLLLTLAHIQMPIQIKDLGVIKDSPQIYIVRCSKPLKPIT